MIGDKIKEVKEQINSLDSGTTLVAVSKTKPKEMIEEAYKAGQRDFGENRVLELVEKREYFDSKGYKDIRWHLIGHLQSNKVKHAVVGADIFHCVDSVKLANRLDRYCEEEGRTLEIMIQINSSGEEQKAGINPKDIKSFIESLSTLNSLTIVGLMSIGMFNQNPDDSREEFRLMKKLFDSIKDIKQSNYQLKYLSMGMSNDYMVAIEEGANLVRVGSKIFGERNYKV